ncbi:hypothetical protein AB205_0059250 [Aquarana catesbeiana]|uniref:Uncharacterized protein n=1 Tax=Aquarana catesbeiana TaxID=8400 RepID=A0A2G9RFB8_AQUCT|nr:hypothetical protein AB205_0059250 [Aquarana catesbeiana]
MGEALDLQGTHQVFSSKIGGLRSPYLMEYSLVQKSQRSEKQQMTSVSPGCGHTRDCIFCQTRLNPGLVASMQAKASSGVGKALRDTEAS